MSYTIPLSNNSILTTVQDGTFNNQYSNINLVGKNFVGYGQLMNENFIHLLENFSNANPPVNPLVGQLWYDSGKKSLKIFGSDQNWLEISYSNSSNQKPNNPKIGDQWWDTKNSQINVWTGDDWLLIGPNWNKSQGLSGFVTENVVDNGGITHVVMKIYIGQKVVGVWSKDEPFVLSSEYVMPGISATIRPGLTFSLLGSTTQNILNGSGVGGYGSTGPTGPSGPIGPIGYTGSEGPSGPTGPSGLKGESAIGPRGFAGSNGSSGPTGPRGFTGSNGPGLDQFVSSIGGSPNQILYINSGNVLNSTSSLSYTDGNLLSVTGSILASRDITAFSDISLKYQIETISNPLSLVKQLRGVDYLRIDDGSPGTGVIAQEIEKVIPSLVSTNDDGIKSVNYGAFAGLFIEAFKAQQDQIDDLKKQLDKLSTSIK